MSKKLISDSTLRKILSDKRVRYQVIVNRLQRKEIALHS